jgi:hypothetical protein
MSSVDFNSSSSTSMSNSSDASDDTLWDVQEILAERTSCDKHKQNELLVVWKTCWVPKGNVKRGPVLQRFKAAPKFKFSSAAGDIYWAVEPGTQLAIDVAAAQEAQRARMSVAAHQLAIANVRDGTPRKQLGSVAKRAFAPGGTGRGRQ